jgi:5'-3' exonuclease
MLRAALDTEEEIDGCVVVWDYGKSKFRTTLYPEYKANRERTEEREADYAIFHEQQAWLSEVLPLLGITISRCLHWEADDVLAFWTKVRSRQNLHSVVMTGDHDLVQLLRPKVSILNSDGKSRTTVQSLWDEWGITPKQWAIARTLCKDSSDNITGIPGIGLKTAIKIIKAGWPNLDWTSQPGITDRLVKLVTEHHAIITRNEQLMNLSAAALMLAKELHTKESILEFGVGQLDEKQAKFNMVQKGMAELIANWTSFVTPFRKLV